MQVSSAELLPPLGRSRESPTSSQMLGLQHSDTGTRCSSAALSLNIANRRQIGVMMQEVTLAS